MIPVAEFWLDVMPWIVVAWICGAVTLCTGLLIYHLRAERHARNLALRELGRAVAEARPADETRHAPEGQLVQLWPVRARRHTGPRGDAA